MPELHFESVHFTGRVQGVGFRYSALQVSKEFEVSGWVANLPDGRVQLEVEGQKAEVERFLAAIEERMHGHIRKTERTSARRVPQFRGFAIR
jgi:acylphosphatase